jgi:hypothetical protein
MKWNWKDESGQMIMLTVISMTLFMAFLALAIDVGLLFRAKRNAQIAADSAAIAAAMEAQYGYTGCKTVGCAADDAALKNGFAATDVTVNTPVKDGYHTGSGYVEVIVSHANPTFFIGAFYGRPTAFKVSARAVAGIISSPACMYILDPTGSDSLYIKGKGQITAPGCGIQVDSSSSTATCNQGAAKISAPYLHIVGKQDTHGPCKKTPNTQVVTNVQPTGDPFNNLQGPIPPGGCTTTNVGLDAAGNLTGVIAGPGAGNAACYSYMTGKKGTTPTQVNLSNATLGPGIYVFETGVSLANTVKVNGGTLDIEQGAFSQNNSQLSITAPTTGPTAGIALMQPSTNSNTTLQVQFGNGNEDLTGIIYAPTSVVTLQDEGGGVQAGGVIAYDISVNSDLILTESYNVANPNSPLNKVALVE